MPAPISLRTFAGQDCQIVSIQVPEGSAVRLKALGIFEGQHVALAKRGNPLIVKAAGGRVAIAAELAEHILVQVPDV